MTNYKSLINRMKELYDSSCIRTAGVVGTGIHLYSLGINGEHLQGIYDDFANGHYLRGTLKAAVPYALPYCISFYSRSKAKREAQRRINVLEGRIRQLEGLTD